MSTRIVIEAHSSDSPAEAGIVLLVTDPGSDDASVEAADIIGLSIPASHEFVRLARIGVASLARRKGLSVRAIDDLRLAIDESFRLLLGDAPDQAPGTVVEVTFEVDEHELAVVLSSRAGDTIVDDESLEQFHVVLAELVDRFDADLSAGVVQFSKLIA